MATANFKTAAAKASNKATFLLEIDLIGTGTTYDSSKTIYLSDRYLIIESVDYEGIVLDWGGLDVDLPSNEGIASINDFSVTLANQRLMFFEADVRFSDILDDYYFAGSVARVYQWFDELTAKSDAELIFTGICKQPNFDLSEISFEITEDDSVFIDLPTKKITLNEYANAPEDNIGMSLPIIFGDDCFFSEALNKNASVLPCIQVDQNLKKYCIAGHKTAITDLGVDGANIVIYLEDAGLYGYLYAPNSSTTTDDEGTFFTLGENTEYKFFAIPRLKGSEYLSAITDYTNILDYDISTTITLQENETFYLKFDKFPRLGSLEYSLGSSILIYVYVNAVTGGSPYGTVKYYNPGYDAGAGEFSTGQNITAAGAVTQYNVKTDKSAHGTDDGQGDKNYEWSLDDLAGLEIGVTVNAGCTITISYIYLFVSRVPFFEMK